MACPGAGREEEARCAAVSTTSAILPRCPGTGSRAVRAGKGGLLQAGNELVQTKLRLVIDLAKNHQNRSLRLSDPVSAGNLGLMPAVERFELRYPGRCKRPDRVCD